METFELACGAHGPLILDVEERAGERSVRRVFDAPLIMIGSDPRSELCFDQVEVSRRHALLLPIAGRLYCLDLASRTGTQIEGELPEGGWVVQDQPIRVGQARIWAMTGTAPESDRSSKRSSPLSRGSNPSNLGYSVALKIGGRAHPSPIVLSRVLTLIGRSPRCKIRLKAPESSRFHAALLQTSTGLWVVDLRSSSPTLINGTRSAIAKLEEGDELRAGPLVGIVSYSGASLGEARPRSENLSATGKRLLSLRASHPSEVDLQPLIEQIANIQHQSSDQFGQVILMVTQLFGSMHREMVDLVREELEQVRRLAKEIHQLRDDFPVKSSQNIGGVSPRTEGLPPKPVKTSPTRKETDDAATAENPRNPAEVHQIVSERLAAFELERRGRWTKISKLLLKTSH